MQMVGSDYRPFCLAIGVPERAFLDRVVSWAEFTWVCGEGEPVATLSTWEARRGRNRAQGAVRLRGATPLGGQLSERPERWRNREKRVRLQLWSWTPAVRRWGRHLP